MLLDLSHTSHTQARTGIQRQSRSLQANLGGRAQPVCLDPYLRGWRALERWELDTLSSATVSAWRRTRWPLRARLSGMLGRWLRTRRAGGERRSAAELDLFERHRDSAFLTPELYSPAVESSLPRLFAAIRGPTAAIFCDAIALQLPEFAPPKTVARYPSYLRSLLEFDGVTVISADSKAVLTDYWAWLGVRTIPEVQAIPLGVDPPPAGAGGPTDPTRPPVILCVGTLEGRKNHLALVEACESLWAAGQVFVLRIVGMGRPETARPALERIETLKRAGRPLRFEGPVSEAELERAYAESAFTIYPSLIEGFGLPVIESLARGKPCICAARGALGEIAPGGGCLALHAMDAPGIAAAILRLLADVPERERLAAEARRRRFRTWADYSNDVAAWLATVKPKHAKKLRG